PQGGARRAAAHLQRRHRHGAGGAGLRGRRHPRRLRRRNQLRDRRDRRRRGAFARRVRQGWIVNVGVLVSGSGTNLQAILDAQERGELGGARVVVVLSNVAGVKALERAEKAGVPTVVLPHKSFPSREAFDEALVAALREKKVDLVAL